MTAPRYGRTIQADPEVAMRIRHRGFAPRADETVFIAPTATLVGNVHVGPESRIMYNAVLDAEASRIDIGECTVICENAVIRATDQGDAPHPVWVGDHVFVSPHTTLLGCRVESATYIATNATILQGATVHSGSVVAVGAPGARQRRHPQRLFRAALQHRHRRPGPTPRPRRKRRPRGRHQSHRFHSNRVRRKPSMGRPPGTIPAGNPSPVPRIRRPFRRRHTGGLKVYKRPPTQSPGPSYCLRWTKAAYWVSSRTMCSLYHPAMYSITLVMNDFISSRLS